MTLEKFLNPTLATPTDDEWFLLDFKEYLRPFHIYTWSRNYLSLDDNNFANIEEFIDDMLYDGAFDKIRVKSIEEGKSKIEFVYELVKMLDKKGYIAFPVLSYEHGSISYYLGHSIDRFDGSIAGFAWASKEDLRKAIEKERIGKKEKEAFKKFISELLEKYTAYVNGE